MEVQPLTLLTLLTLKYAGENPRKVEQIPGQVRQELNGTVGDGGGPLSAASER
jgi:hypothetical protein